MKVERKASFDIKRLHSSYGKVKITKEINVGMTRLWKDSARAFLQAVATDALMTSHVDTGMSKGSLLPLARLLRAYTLAASTIPASAQPKKGAYDIGGRWHPGAERSIQAGVASGQKSFEFKTGSEKHMIFKFHFEISVWQYLINEHGLGRTEAWDTLQKGKDAFWNFYNSHFDEYVKNKIARKRFSDHV